MARTWQNADSVGRIIKELDEVMEEVRKFHGLLIAGDIDKVQVQYASEIERALRNVRNFGADGIDQAKAAMFQKGHLRVGDEIPDEPPSKPDLKIKKK